MRAKAKRCLCGVLIAYNFISLPLTYVVSTLGLLTEPPPFSDAGCKRLLGPIGAEDGAFLPELGVVIVSELDNCVLEFLHAKQGGGPANAVNGALWSLDRLNYSQPRLMRLAVPLPSGVDFHSHGLGLHGNILFVVNHAYRNGGERIERFRVERSSDPDGPPVRLIYLSSVLGHDGDVNGQGKWTLTERLNGIINDVAPVGDQEFFFTQYHDAPASMDDGFEEEGMLHMFERLLLPWTRKCRIYHCRCAKEAAEGGCARTSCGAVGPAGVTWNGISASRDGRSLYVDDSNHRQVVHFRIDRSDAGGVTLARQRAITWNYPFFADNVDVSSGTLWAGLFSLSLGDARWPLVEKSEAAFRAASGSGGAAPRPYTHIARESPESRPSEPVPGVALRVDLSTGKVTPAIVTSLLWQVSFAGSMDGKVVLGSAFDEGVLVCPEPVVE